MGQQPIVSIFVTRLGTSKEITLIGDLIAVEEGGRWRFKPIAYHLSPESKSTFANGPKSSSFLQ